MGEMINWRKLDLTTNRTFNVKNDGFYGAYMKPASFALNNGLGMICCTGADGSFFGAKGMAAIFRKEGIPAIALAYFHAEGTPEEDLESPVEYVERAAVWLLQNGCTKVGIWGISLGGEYALLAGSLLPVISCVVACSPVHAVVECGNVYGGFHFTGGSPFSYQGKPVPYISVGKKKAEEISARVHSESLKRHEFYMRFYYEDLLMRPHGEAADIRVENIHGPVLLISGGADTCVPADWVCEQVVTRRKEKHVPYATVHKNYEHLSHYALPARPVSSFIFQEERKYRKECNESRAQSWEDTKAFLHEYVMK